MPSPEPRTWARKAQPRKKMFKRPTATRTADNNENRAVRDVAEAADGAAGEWEGVEHSEHREGLDIAGDSDGVLVANCARDDVDGNEMRKLEEVARRSRPRCNEGSASKLAAGLWTELPGRACYPAAVHLRLLKS